MLRHRPNGKLLLILLAGTATLGLGVHLLHRSQVSRSAALLKTRSEKAQAERRFDDAENLIKRYLLMRPDDVVGQLAYARLIEKRDPSPANQASIMGAFERVVLLDESQTDARRHLIDLALGLKLYSKAQPHIESLRRANPDDGELTFLLGRCADGTGDFAKAVELYEQARQQVPTRIEVFVRLADLLRTRLREATRADAVMDARAEQGGLISKNGRSAAAYLARARYRARYAIPNVDPSADITQALKLAPDDAEVIIAAAGQARAQGDLVRARTLLERGCKQHSRNGPMYQALADLELQADQADLAVKAFSAGITALKGEHIDTQIGLRWGLVNTLIDLGRLNEATAEIKFLSDQGLRPVLLGYLDARLLVTRGRYAAAAWKLRDLLPQLSAAATLPELTKRSLILLGRCYERLGNSDQRYVTFDRAVAIELDPDPVWIPARRGLAEALVEINKIEDAIEQYRIILPREPGVGLALARLQIVQNLRKPAANRRWQDVEQALASVERGLGDTASPRAVAEIAILRAEALASRGDIVSAHQLLAETIAKHPDQVGLWVILANLAGRNGKPEETLFVLDEAQRKLGNKVELLLARIGYWTHSKGQAAVEALEKMDRESTEMPPDDLLRVRRELAIGFARLGQVERTAALWRRLVEQSPDDLEIRLVLFDLALQAGDRQAIENTLVEIRRIEGDNEGTFWRYARALTLLQRFHKDQADRNVLTEARDLLQQVVTLRPNWARAPLALSEVEQLADNPEAAIQQGLRAVSELRERDPASVGRVLKLLIENGRVDEAGRIVQQLRTEQMPLSGELEHLASEVSFRSGDPAFALDLARRSVTKDTKDPSQVIWLGLLQAAAGENAEQTLRQAVALDPARPDARLALIRYLASIGRTDDARVALAEAEKALPANRGRLELAQANEAIGNDKRAADFYEEAQQALADKPENDPASLSTLRAAAAFDIKVGRFAEAEIRLKRVIELGGSSTNAAWARRIMPLILAIRGDRVRSLRALETLGLTSSVRSDSTDTKPEDLRARALALALQPNRIYRNQAILALETLVRRKASSVADLRLLAQLHDANNDWDRARARFLEVINANPKDPEPLASYIRALLRHDQRGEAEAHLPRLQHLVPDAPSTVEIEARVLAARGKIAEAVKRLEEFATTDPSRIEFVTRILEEMGQYAPAEAMYRRFDALVRPRNPQAALVLAGYLGRRGRTSEALAVLDLQAWRTIPPATISNAGATILYNARDDDDAPRAAVAERIAALIRDRPEIASLRFDLANVRILQGRYADAEAIYRELHEQDRTIGAPLNNLAWLLAIRGGDRASESLSLIQQAISLEGESPDLLDTRALAYLATGQLDPAIVDLENSLVVDPLPETYYHLARAHYAKGQVRDAKNALRHSQDLGLTIENLHPLERPAFRELIAALVPR
jgi:tetratricopeptide (TPR) repeat protein